MEIMNIAICEDNKLECDVLKNKIIQYFKDKDIELKIDVFDIATRILNQSVKYDIVFMDIEFKNENGLEVLDVYRKNHSSLNILVTSHKEYMPDGYRIKAFRYLCKPINDLKLTEALDSAIKELNDKKKFIVETKDGLKVISENEIIYIEAGDKYVGIRTSNDFFCFLGTISCIKEEINPLMFVMPHRTYIVNMNFIQRIDDRYVYLCNGELVKISKLRKKEFKEKFFSFIRGKAINE